LIEFVILNSKISVTPGAVKDADEPKLSVALVQKLDPLTKRVIGFIVNFLQVRKPTTTTNKSV